MLTPKFGPVGVLLLVKPWVNRVEPSFTFKRPLSTSAPLMVTTEVPAPAALPISKDGSKLTFCMVSVPLVGVMV